MSGADEAGVVPPSARLAPRVASRVWCSGGSSVKGAKKKNAKKKFKKKKTLPLAANGQFFVVSFSFQWSNQRPRSRGGATLGDSQTWRDDTMRKGVRQLTWIR